MTQLQKRADQRGCEFINVADLTDPNDPQGRTYRQVNAERQHAIPLGALVEFESGERLFVKKHTRDCDQTPLYSLGMSHDDDPHDWQHGYGEESLSPCGVDTADGGRHG